METKLSFVQSSAQLFYFLYHGLTICPIPLQFFTVGEGIDLWNYEETTDAYTMNHIMPSGSGRRGEMNEEGIYVLGGGGSLKVQIYDMKYYNYPDKKIQLLNSFSDSNSVSVSECIFTNSVSVLCCDRGGYIKEYDLSNPHSIPPPTVFNKTALSDLQSLIQTKDKKYIIAGGKYIFYILDAKDGTLKNTHSTGKGWSMQIAEIRPNILAIASWIGTYEYDIKDIQNITPLPSGQYYGGHYTVIALNSNLGDFAVGGNYLSRGFVYIHHLEEDNRTITFIKKIDNIPGDECFIRIIRELKKGVILFGGDSSCTQMCLWKYMAIPSQEPQCWEDQTTGYIWDIAGVPY